MSSENRVSATLSAEDIKIINDALELARLKLPFLISLSDDERRRLSKMGNNSVSFDEKCATYMGTHPQLLPGFVPIGEVLKDRELRLQLIQLFTVVQTLCDAIDDTIAVLESEVYQADLAFYQSVRFAMKRGLFGAASIYADLRERFVRRATPPEPEAPPTEPNANPVK